MNQSRSSQQTGLTILLQKGETGWCCLASPVHTHCYWLGGFGTNPQTFLGCRGISEALSVVSRNILYSGDVEPQGSGKVFSLQWESALVCHITGCCGAERQAVWGQAAGALLRAGEKLRMGCVCHEGGF